MKKIIFCFPYLGVGGVSMVFLWVSEMIAQIKLADVYIVDYADGFMAKNQNKSLTTLIEYKDHSIVDLPKDAIVVFQSMTPWSIYPSLKIYPETRIFFWNCHPFNLVPTMPGIRAKMQSNITFGKIILNCFLKSYRNKIVKLINSMNEKNALVFMDSTNLKTTEQYLGIKIDNAQYLPIPAKSVDMEKSLHTPDFIKNGMQLAWVGRICDFKYFILKHTIEQLDKIQPDLDFPIKMTVVGSGDYAESLKSFILCLENIDVFMIDHIPPDKMSSFIQNEVDVMLSMGTSALEGAMHGIPTILLDVFYSKVPDGYPFRWLFERKGFTIGDILEDNDYVIGNNSLLECLEAANNDYNKLSEKCLDYFELNHALNTVAEKLLVMLDKATFTYADIEGTNRGGLYNLFALLRRLFR